MTDDWVARGKAINDSGKHRPKSATTPDPFGIAGAEFEISTEPPFDPGPPPPLYLVEDDDDDLPDLEEEPSDALDHHAGEWAAPDAEALIARRVDWLRINREARRRLDDEERPPTVAPPLDVLTALLAEPETPVEYLIDGVAPAASRVILSAQWKAGKTTIVGNLIRALADLQPFLGRFAVNTAVRRVVLLDNELSRDMNRRWLRDQRITNTDAVVVCSLRGRLTSFDLLDDRRRRQWVAWLVDLHCDYLILDCLRPVLDVLGLDEGREAGRFLVAFDRLLDEAGIADAVIVHHMGHTGERARGDSRLEDWPDVIWRMVREDHDDVNSARYFSAIGRDVSVPEGRLTYDPVTRHMTYANGSRNDGKVDSAHIAVVGLLADGEPLSGRAIEDQLVPDHPRTAVRAAIKHAVNRSVLAVDKGPKNSKLHRIAYPCSECGLPVTAREEHHLSCPSGPEPLSDV